MKLSTKARYGTRAMVELGMVYPNQTLSARKIAEGLNISVKYLEQIMGALKAFGLIKAVRGVNGGYSLTRPPESMRLLDVFHALDGEPVFVDCLLQPEECAAWSTCAARDVWKEMNDTMADILMRTTVADLVESSHRKRGAQTKMYHI